MNKIRKIHITGIISAKYTGTRDYKSETPVTREYLLSVYDAEMMDVDARDKEQINPAPEDFMTIGNLDNIRIFPKDRSASYRANIEDIKVFKPKLTNIVRHENRTYGTLTGMATALMLVHDITAISEASESSGLEPITIIKPGAGPKPPIDWKQGFKDLVEVISYIPLIIGAGILAIGILSIIASIGAAGWISVISLGLLYWVYPFLLAFIISPFISLLTWLYGLLQNSAGVNLLSFLLDFDSLNI